MMVKGLLHLLPIPLLATPVVLQIEEGGKDHTTYSTSLATTESEIHFSGTMHVDMTLHPVTGKPHRFVIISGTTHYSDAVVDYTEEEVFGATRLRITTTELSGPYLTTNPDAIADPDSGLIENSDHEVHLTSGTLRTEIDSFFSPIWLNLYDITRDYNQEPEINHLSGTTTVTSELVESKPFTDTFKITVTHTSDPEPGVIDVFGDELRVKSVGGFTASGQADFPSVAFQTWLNAVTTPPAGQPDRIRYALGQSSNQRNLIGTIQPGVFSLNLPDSGTKAPLTVTVSSDLETWTPLGDTIPAGTSGLLAIPLPESARFVRLELPSS